MNRELQGNIQYIQTMLRKLSFYDDDILRVIPDGIYGSETEDSVKSFQRSVGLPETGEVDNDTWDRLDEKYREILRVNELDVCVKAFGERREDIRPGDSGPALYVIQAMMVALSEKFSNIGTVFVTGIFDDATAEAVRKIQIISGITPNDTINREFVNSLSELYNTFVTVNRVDNLSSENAQ